mgnify:CR=1 FL=1
MLTYKSEINKSELNLKFSPERIPDSPKGQTQEDSLETIPKSSLYRHRRDLPGMWHYCFLAFYFIKSVSESQIARQIDFQWTEELPNEHLESS